MRWLRLRCARCCYCGRLIRFWDRYSTRRLRNHRRVSVHYACGERMREELQQLRAQRALRRLRERMSCEPGPNIEAMTGPELDAYLAGLGLRSDLAGDEAP